MSNNQSLKDAFIAGFMASGEGFNGEYPFYGDEQKVRDNEVVQRHFKEFSDQ